MYKAGDNMYKIIYMKADYEPWWKFDDWETKIVNTYVYETEEEFKEGLDQLLTNFRNRYEHEKFRDNMYAFWSDDEVEYCESCEEDVQIFHGIIIKKVE